MIKIFAISVIAIFFFNGCGSSSQTETILVPKPYLVCNELEIYKVEDQEFKNRVRPLDLGYLEAKKEQYKRVIESYEKQTLKEIEEIAEIEAVKAQYKKASEEKEMIVKCRRFTSPPTPLPRRGER